MNKIVNSVFNKNGTGAILRRFSILCVVLSSFATISCTNNLEVFTYTALYKGVRLESSGEIVHAADYIDESSSFNAGRGVDEVRLSVSANGYSTVVLFSPTPAVNQTIEYRPSNQSNIEFDFFVIHNADNVVITSRSATITGLSDGVSESEFNSQIPRGDSIVDKRSFSFVIQWNDSRISGEVYIVKSSHFESDPLLN